MHSPSLHCCECCESPCPAGWVSSPTVGHRSVRQSLRSQKKFFVVSVPSNCAPSHPHRRAFPSDCCEPPTKAHPRMTDVGLLIEPGDNKPVGLSGPPSSLTSGGDLEVRLTNPWRFLATKGDNQSSCWQVPRATGHAAQDPLVRKRIARIIQKSGVVSTLFSPTPPIQASDGLSEETVA